MHYHQIITKFMLLFSMLVFGEQTFEVSDYVQDNVAELKVNLLPTIREAIKLRLTNSASAQKIILDLRVKKGISIHYKIFTVECLSHCNLEIINEPGTLNITQMNLINVSLLTKPKLTVENLSMQSFEAITTALPKVMKEAEITIKSSTDMMRVRQLLKSINIIPATGEFVYDPTILYQKDGVTPINMNSDVLLADSVYNLKSLKTSVPNLQWAAPVVAWFGVNNGSKNKVELDVKHLSILPGVDHQDEIAVEKWQVSEFNRQNAYLITKDANHRSNYGGTINDNSILRYIELLKDNRYNVMFYPMIFMDMPGKPWRGAIMAKDAGDIEHFFNKPSGYNEFILHYAKMLRNKVDAFVLGSELHALTGTIDARYEYPDERRYPAVCELAKLAKKVKDILGPKVIVTYAANWSEYHHDDLGFPHLDSLWASPDIDVVGIDAYLPVTDKMKGEVTLDDIKKGWQSGELWDYIYDGAKALPIAPEWGMKHIELWWKTEHEVKGIKSRWRPKMKPIWFTEFGFPSMHMATNQPSIYYDPNKGRESRPKRSSSNPDFVLQMRAIRATLEYWQDKSDIVQNMFLWAWDVRPFPYYPTRLDLWSDGNLWSRGHWINGKIEPFKQVKLMPDFDVGILRINADELVIDNMRPTSKAHIIAQNVMLKGNIQAAELAIKAKSVTLLEPLYIDITGTLDIELDDEVIFAAIKQSLLSAHHFRLRTPKANIDIKNLKDQNIVSLLLDRNLPRP